MYGNRHQAAQAIYLRDMARHKALVRGGTPFGEVAAIEVPSVYQIGGGRQLTQALVNRQKRKAKALFGVALRAFMKKRRGIPLTPIEVKAFAKVGGNAGLRAWFEPQGIDIEAASTEGEIVEMAPEDEVLAVEAVHEELKGEEMGFGTVVLIAAAVSAGVYLIGKVL
jgi:hypothetical protein